jgi:glycosyltransferase involved in cell wall biosynthesis
MAQANHLRQFNPYFAGVQHLGGIPLPADRTCSCAGRGLSGAIAARWFKITGFSPGFLDKLRRIRPALVHAHFEESGLAALPLTRQLDVPLITTFHGYDATATPSSSVSRRLLNHVYARQRERLQREGSLFVAVSEFIRKKLIERGYPEDRTITVPIGVDVEMFKPSLTEPPSPMVLFVGRMVEKKGVPYLLEAMAEVAKTRQDARLVLIGDGPLMPAMIDKACALKLPNVVFMGKCDAAMVRQQMSIASMLVAPSVTAASGDSEGLPIVVCEAQAMGLPVVGTQHAGIPEIIHHEKNGYLVPERSVHQLARRISLILSRPALRRQMGEAGRANVCLNYNLKIQNALLESIYAKTVRDHEKRKALV